MGVHPIVLRKMRNYAIKQALSELPEQADPKQIETIAKRHLLSYTELKQAINRERREKEEAQAGHDAQ